MNKYNFYFYENPDCSDLGFKREVEMAENLRELKPEDWPAVVHARVERLYLDPYRYTVIVESEPVDGKGYGVRIDPKQKA